jgi:hypothetical protein
MPGGTMQLAAYGIEDMFLTNDPQITYFKIVYRRHTNFTIEEIRQNFIQISDFGSKVTANISKVGDLMEKTTLVINLPKINPFKDGISQVAWVKNIGYRIIKSISIEINGRTISKNYGEWMYLWNEMFSPLDNKMDKITGNIEELINYSYSKNEYVLYIPLQFWFCRNAGNALPLISMIYSDIKINLEINSLDYCLKITPTHYIKCDADIINFIKYEKIIQSIDGQDNIGEFLYYDINERRLYYYLISTNNFQSIPYGTINTAKYNIVGSTSNFICSPYTQQTVTKVITPQSYALNKLTNLHLGDTFLLVNYVYLDDEERMKFAQSKHDYLIDYVYFTENNEVTGPTELIKVDVDNPCKYMLWVLQQQYIYNSKNYDDYTDGNDNNLIIDETILLNQKERLSFRNEKYFSLIQPYEYSRNSPPNGVNMFSFGLNVNSTQPSGTCNMSKIESIEIRMRTKPILSTNNMGICRVYCETYNILRVANGYAGVIFER